MGIMKYEQKISHENLQKKPALDADKGMPNHM